MECRLFLFYFFTRFTSTMALVGKELNGGDKICSAIVSLHSKVNHIELWTLSAAGPSG